MKILWFPRLQYDVDRLHLVTWKEMAKALERQGHAVRVAVAGIPENETPPGWIRLPLIPAKGLRLLGFALFGYAAFLWQCLRFRPDLVLLDVYSAGFAAPAIWFFRDTTWLLDQRTPIGHTSQSRNRFRRAAEDFWTASAMAFARRRFDGLTTITADFRTRMTERFGIPPDRIGVWGSGFDAERFDPARIRPADRPEELRGRFIVFQHGELSRNRGLPETVRALREPGLENAALVLLGAGPAQEDVRRTARECGVEERVRILPPVPHADIPAQIAGFDCAVMAYPVDDYWNCNHPIKFVEALAMGKTVVGTPIAVVREAGPAARFLEVIPDNRPESIAAGIRRCMAATDRPERGRAAIAYVRGNATWEAQAAKLMAFVATRRASPTRAAGIPLTIFHPMDPRGTKVGGAETFVRGLIRHAPADFDVELVGISATGPAGGEWLLAEGAKPFRFRPVVRVKDENRRSLVPLSLRYALALWPRRRRFAGRILFFNRIEPFWLFCRRPGPKLVAIHNDVQKQIASGPGEVLWSRFPRLYFALEKRCLPAADLVLSESGGTVDDCQRRYPGMRDRIARMSTWFDPELFSPPEQRAEEKRALAQRHPGLRADSDWILYTGRYQPQKAPIRLIEAFALVHRHRPEAMLLLSGEGNLKEDMSRMAVKRGLQDSVVFLDSVRRPDLAAWYRAADAFLLASDYEGMPIAVLEALACGLPVASTPVGEVPALVTPGSTGEIAAAYTAEALAEALERILSRRDRYAASACVAAVRDFTPQAVLRPLFDRLRALANQGAAAVRR